MCHSARSNGSSCKIFFRFPTVRRLLYQHLEGTRVGPHWCFHSYSRNWSRRHRGPGRAMGPEVPSTGDRLSSPALTCAAGGRPTRTRGSRDRPGRGRQRSYLPAAPASQDAAVWGGTVTLKGSQPIGRRAVSAGAAPPPRAAVTRGQRPPVPSSGRGYRTVQVVTSPPESPGPSPRGPESRAVCYPRRQATLRPARRA